MNANQLLKIEMQLSLLYRTAKAETCWVTDATDALKLLLRLPLNVHVEVASGHSE